MAMDISPMNYQLLVPKSTEVGQQQNNMHNMVNAQQGFTSLLEKREAEQKLKSVQERDNAEDGKIKDDPNRKGQGGFSGGRRHKGQEEQEPEEEERMAVDTYRGHRIDISL